MADRLAIQRRRAAARGNAVRSRRAEIKQMIADGTLDIVDVLNGKVEHAVVDVALEIPVDQLLRAVPGIGPTTASELGEEAGVPSGARLAGLSDVVIGRLVAALEAS